MNLPRPPHCADASSSAAAGPPVGEAPPAADDTSPSERPGEVGLIDLTDRSGPVASASAGVEGATTMEELLQLNQQKDAFLRMVSHDLRTPLLVIERFATILRDVGEGLSADERLEYAQRIADSSQRLQRQLADLLDVDRLGRGVIEPNRRPTDLRDLVVDTVRALGLEARVGVDGDALIVDVDPGHVERIVENLLSNADRHGPVDGRIAIRLARHDDGVLITVDDDGDGVPVALRELVFEVFRAGPGIQSGTGVGLSVVRRLAELHGGRAWIDEAPGGGASLNVTLSTDLH